MNVVDLYPSLYCLYIKDMNDVERMFFQKDVTPGSSRRRLDLFESPEVAQRWIESEQTLFLKNDHANMHNIYGRLYPKKINALAFQQLMNEHENLDSITIVDNDRMRRLYFRDDFIHGYEGLLAPSKPLNIHEPIYMINRQKKLNEKTILQKESYFVVYPVIATPLFSAEMIDWAEELVLRYPDDGYYIEQTTLSDLSMRLDLETKDPGFFILSQTETSLYVLRKDDIDRLLLQDLVD